MVRKMTCIECPRGCALSIEMEGPKIISVTGNECPKGLEYSRSEIENPLRIVTSAVIAEGLSLKMIPVRTDRPILKSKVLKAMEEIRRIRIKRPLKTGDIIVRDFLSTGANLVATREVSG